MTIHDAIAAALPELRAQAESLMTDTFEFRLYADGWEYDANEGVEIRVHEVLFAYPGKIVTSTQPSASQVGERTAITVDRELHIPAASPTVPVGVVARRARDGAEFEVLADVTHQQPKSRRLRVVEVLS